jgi:hypothetical protein
MKQYSQYISLNKNFRGVYELDTSKGCTYGLSANKMGCYGECYALKSAKIYGMDFRKTVLRNFKDLEHLHLVRNQLYGLDTPFIRIGVTGDPSCNWEHTLKIIGLVSAIKPIVLVTKHWNKLTLTQLKKLSYFNVCVNTSVSALDNKELIQHRLTQYNVLKNYCKSVLRIVSCDFNTTNLTGLVYNDIQDMLFCNIHTIDNILRVSKNNPLVKLNIIKVESRKFLSTKTLVSQKNKNTFLGFCLDCPDQCGINVN